MPVKRGYKMETLRQDDEGVTVTFEKVTVEQFSSAIECDNLRSNTRKALFGEQLADSIGITAVMSCLPSLLTAN